MVRAEQIVILSLDDFDEVLSIEGEILFEGELNSSFSAEYDYNNEEFISIDLEIDFIKYDEEELEEMILEACDEFEE